MKNLIQQLDDTRDRMLQVERRYVAAAGEPHPNYVDSKRNLLHYLALRAHDLRPLQHALAALGLSSLGRVESHVLPSIDAVLTALHSLDGKDVQQAEEETQNFNFEIGNRLLELHSRDLLGSSPHRRSVRIMVTLPSEAEHDYTLIHSLLQNGMDVARINCAHDGPAVWERMIRHIRRAEKAQGLSCRILMDLGGPKLRTGPIEAGPAVLKWGPKRNALGAVIRPSRIWITAAEQPSNPPSQADATVPMPADWISRLRQGNKISFRDARNARRDMTVVDITTEGCWAEAVRTAYVTPGIFLTRHDSGLAQQDVSPIADFPPSPGAIDLFMGDTLILTRQLRPGRPATREQRRHDIESGENSLHLA